MRMVAWQNNGKKPRGPSPIPNLIDCNRELPRRSKDLPAEAALVRAPGRFYHDFSLVRGTWVRCARWGVLEEDRRMSIDKSLRRKNSLQRARNVLTRGERIKVLKDEERWQEGRSPYN